ncbi:cysteine--tRNA ligase [Candidatus Finniella inopinata]|uniref:Cysteine--tRNA ligase n=1 Tax=Candidatus Finniella inopinata TaxID=1696036 RepID=A0A4Q7DJJ7_9PROT|nr:cysteine--tRNA ligase [Candidatus Finniella inopinata]RZI46922.1 cysteine--tRNA ligase [Candidatus Finniella inopinata]
MSLILYNSLTRQKEPFQPIDTNHVGMYVCGPTVYDRAHLGNARPVVVFDVLFRLLKQLYPKVTYARNITDVDDKINAACLARDIPIHQLTAETTAAYHQDMDALGALSPDHEPRATAHIPQMTQMILTLIDKGYAYEAEGHVLFLVEKYSDYGDLSRRNQDELLAGARVEVAPYKRNPQDFVLWKPSTAEQPGWESPWGRGRPGWHIECSAMSAEYLGQTFDIHGGGIDLIFPHHENERAQSCCAHGTEKMARYWMHNGHLTVSGSKMSKSLGNFFTVHDLLKNHRGETIRLALLTTHYRQPLDWRPDLLTQAKQTLDRWYGLLNSVDLILNEAEQGDENVFKALQDDLNTPQAIVELHALAHEAYKTESSVEKIKLAQRFKKSADLLGLLQQNPQQWLQQEPTCLTTQEIESLIHQRHQARQNRDFAGADEIRKSLLEKGIQLEDKDGQTFWRSV